MKYNDQTNERIYIYQRTFEKNHWKKNQKIDRLQTSCLWNVRTKILARSFESSRSHIPHHNTIDSAYCVPHPRTRRRKSLQVQGFVFVVVFFFWSLSRTFILLNDWITFVNLFLDLQRQTLSRASWDPCTKTKGLDYGWWKMIIF